MSQQKEPALSAQATPLSWWRALLWGSAPSALLAFFILNSLRIAPEAGLAAVPMIYVAIYALAVTHACMCSTMRVMAVAMTQAAALFFVGIFYGFGADMPRLWVALAPMTGACIGIRLRHDGPFTNACNALFGFLIGMFFGGLAYVIPVAPGICGPLCILAINLMLAVRVSFRDREPLDAEKDDNDDEPWFRF